jgi:serine protease Do
MLVQATSTYLLVIAQFGEDTMTTTRFSKKSVLGLLAAGLLGSTLLTGGVALSQPGQVIGPIEAIDPTKGFSTLAEHVMPAVVSVEVRFQQTASDGDTQNMPQQFRDFFEQFPQFREHFGERGPNNMPRHRRSMAQGSGFLISPDGYVVTNNHVINEADEVKLSFQDGQEFNAKVIGTDPKTDIALLKIDSDKTFPYVSFSGTEAKVGDWVMAVGNPFGLGGTVTAGIVSARGRDIGSGPYDDYLQIDASINKGNSGGPAFNLQGEVIGVNTAIFSPTGGSVGIGFAIPASVVKTVVEDLKGDGKVVRGWLGVQIQPVTEDLAESLGLTEEKGAIVSDVTAGSPALKAGLKQGDVIIKANGQEIEDARDLSKTVAALAPDAKVPFEIIRDGKPETITVTIGTMPGEPQKRAAIGKPLEKLDLSSLGMEVTPAEDGEGLRISNLDPDSAAAEKGLKAGDVILEIAGQHVTGPADAERALSSAKGKNVLLLVRTGDNQRYITLPRERS